jgi:hypothetical protein
MIQAYRLLDRKSNGSFVHAGHLRGLSLLLARVKRVQQIGWHLEPLEPIRCFTILEQFGPMFIPLMFLAVESSGVATLRMMKPMCGGSDALREAELMVSEKVDAAFEAALSLVAGASGDEIVHRYRQLVAVNAKRLGNRA